MKCTECENDCYINEWEGWRWECIEHGLKRFATHKEMDRDKFIKKYFKPQNV